METKLTNPFIISGYVAPEYFCDREAETENLLSALRNGGNVTLTSPRRMGKTGLIRHSFRRLKEEDPSIVTVYADLLSTESLADFARVLSVAIMEQLAITPERVLKKAASLLSRIRPTLTVDPVTGGTKFSVDIAPGEESETLDSLFSYLKNSGKRCIVALDEFQQVALYPEKNVEALLRSHIQFMPNVNFIFSGSRSHMLAEMFLSPKRPFYQSSVHQQVGPIEMDPYYSFSAAFFASDGRILPQEIFQSIYRRYEGHTWYIQKILNKLYAQTIDKEITATSVLKAITEILSENEYYYQMVLRAYSKGQVKLLKAIAKEGHVKEILSGTFISRYKLTATSSVKGALKRLIEDEQVYMDDSGYQVYDRFLAEWLRTQMT